MRDLLLIVCLIWNWFSPVNLAAQCAFDLGNDTIICAGSSITLSALAGMDSYNWNTSATSSSITVNSSGTYICDVSVLQVGTNLIVNGDFSAGNSGFTSQYTYNAGGPFGPVSLGGTYFVTNNPQNAHSNYNPCPDHTTGIGNMMVTNGDTLPGDYMWCQTVAVTPNTDYDFSFWLQSVIDVDPAVIQVSMNGTPFGAPLVAPNVVCNWVQFLDTWNSGPLSSVDICLENLNTVDGGNDYAVDDISLTPYCTFSDTINVTVQPIPNPNLGPDQTICPWDSVQLDVTQANASYLWSTGETASSIYTGAPGLYSVTVTVNGCSGSDAVQIDHHNVATLDLGPDTVLCDGDPLVLASNIPGSTYYWSTGAASAAIPITNSGVYWVDASTFGCVQRDSVNVLFNPNPVVNLPANTSICDYDSILLDASTVGASYQWSNGVTTSDQWAFPDSSYAVIVTVNGCTGTDSISISSIAPPNVSIGPDSAICPWDSLLLDVTIPGGTYLWSDGSTNATNWVSQVGANWVDVTVNGCTASDTMILGNVAVPPVDIGPDQTICDGDSVVFSNANPSNPNLWNDGSTASSLTAFNQGWYWLDATNSGCTQRDSAFLNVNPLPVVNLGADTSLCPGATLLLDASTPGASYSWQNGAISSTFLVSSSGTYWVELTDVNGCVSSDTIQVSYVNTSTVGLGNDTTLCPGASVQIDATVPGGSYIWSTGSGTSSITVNQADTFWVDVSISGCTVRDSIIVDFFAPTQVDLGPDTSICPGDQLVLDATTPGASYVWSDGSTNPTLQTTGTGFYSVTVTDGNGCFSADGITISNIGINPVNLGPDVVLCAGDSVTLNGTTAGATSYAWNTLDVTPTITVQTAGDYILSTDQSGCTVTDTVNVQVQPFPNIDIGPDTLLCPGQSVILDATWPGASYNWSNASTSATINANIAGTYWVDVNVGGCVDQDTIQITYAPPFSVDLGADTTLCPGQTMDLTVNVAGATSIWSTGQAGDTITVNALNTYWVDATVGNCVQSDTIIVNYVNPGALNFGPDQDICDGDSIVLDASSIVGASYTWQDGSTGSTLTAYATGAYWVQASVAGCMVSDTINIQVFPYPIVDLGPDTALCTGEVLTVIVAPVTGSVLWNNGSNANSISMPAGATNWVTVTSNGCTSSDTLVTTALPLPFVDLGSDTLLCAGDTITYTAPVGLSSQLWSDGSTGNDLVVTSSSTIWLQADLNGCISSDTVNVDYLSPDALQLGNDTIICPGDALILDAQITGAAYTWNTGATSSSISVSQAGSYSVVASIAGCTEIDSITVDVEPLSYPDLGADTTICVGDSIVIGISPGDPNVLWNTGAVTDSIQVNLAGSYSVTLSQNGCTTTDSILVYTQGVLDSLDIGPDATTCEGQPVLIDATTPNALYQWSNGANTPFVNVSEAGTYWVEISGFCIEASDTIAVETEDCTPLVYIPNSFSPNGDGINDVFQVAWWGDLTDIELRIFNRWGELLFESDDPFGFWDGLYKGELVQNDVYIYQVVYRGINADGIVQEEVVGHVNVVR